MKFIYGESNFRKLRTEGAWYVDKTRYIDLLEHDPAPHALMLRPRRFGKTLFVNMLGWYYDQRHADLFEPLFTGTYIYDHPTPKRHSYMMLTFNFSGINTETLEDANAGFCSNVESSIRLFTGLYKHHVSKDDRQYILNHQTPADMMTALFQYLAETGLEKCVYVTIDEYDHFANNLLSQGKQMFKDLVRTDGYVRPFYEALKEGTETVVDRMFITGVLPILLDSLTSGFNIAKNCSTDARFNRMFGFTEEEVEPILAHLNEDVKPKDIRTYYNGYRFSPDDETTLYNSDMVIYYAIQTSLEQGPPRIMIDPNVISDYRKIRAILSIGERDVEEQVLTQIIEQERIALRAMTDVFVLTAETEFQFDARAAISLLFYMGYLTITDSDSLSMTLAMPNLVLKSLYWDYMQHTLRRRGQIRLDGLKHDAMFLSLVDGDIALLIELTEQFLKGLSNRDYEHFDEKYIKVVMLSLLPDVNIYIPHSEYEVDADGYVDLYLQAAFEPQKSAHYFIELKYVKARAAKSVEERKAREGREAMTRYLNSPAAQGITNLQAYVLVFRKDRCVRRIACSA